MLLQIFWQTFYWNVSGVVPYKPYEFCQNHWFWLVAMATERLNFRKRNIQKSFFSEAIREMKLKLCMNVHDISLYINCIFFYCRCPCAFVAMATQTFHIHVLIMGKVEIGIYFCVTADILTKFLLKCFWSSPLSTIWILSKSLILIGGYGNRKAKFSKENKKTFKNLRLRSHMGDEAETLHKCLWY